ncbi:MULTISPECIES: beta-ketoacyl-[acyl-carrier-protein] synthase family protein [unclassified Shewanella]|uniref:beta-ketoacyl-[acyl-carrier-protein] synthase family protein n=1 Tax=unclassified Shewanella TaxID=196818 RepID=UPI001BC74B46|nr:MULTISPECIES: beta-ketoacyl-[acyl-carrier-protein] synthase family protein [unclassified Shewanella]GIU11339.1 beta-ketoacyl-[acyl-carrier-protein] synthase II [Shewanella sp. MBTL60-112-B1]GIU31047.1 beta-ketoacyl-[acyl-carrier-protein] synthase II [Shewanella sp. MBTL60-112-B2]
MSSTTPIAITHLGLCTPLGLTPQAVLDNLIAGSIHGMQWREDLLFERAVLVGQVDATLPTIPAALKQFDTRNNQLTLLIAQQIEAAVERAKTQYGNQRIGLVIGTSTSGIATGEVALAEQRHSGEFPQDYDYAKQELGNTSEFLQSYFKLNGPCYTVSTACSSSAKVFGSAKRLIDADVCDMVIVGGIDTLCQLTLNGFHSLESISSGHCQPFSQNRDGINIGEGGALFTLEKVAVETPATESTAIVLSGIGESSDAHHISAPHPEGRGAIAAMQAALMMADLQPEQIDYLNLHGTATPKNDAMESRAVHTVFSSSLPPCSSTKPLTGHTLGAAGAIEAAFCYLLLSDYNKQQYLPPQVWDKQQDPNDPTLALVSKGMQANLCHVMSNSFAFGGSNACLILSRKLSTTSHRLGNGPQEITQDV